MFGPTKRININTLFISVMPRHNTDFVLAYMLYVHIEPPVSVSIKASTIQVCCNVPRYKATYPILALRVASKRHEAVPLRS